MNIGSQWTQYTIQREKNEAYLIKNKRKTFQMNTLEHRAQMTRLRLQFINHSNEHYQVTTDHFYELN